MCGQKKENWMTFFVRKKKVIICDKITVVLEKLPGDIFVLKMFFGDKNFEMKISCWWQYFREEIWQNSKAQIVIQLENSNCGKTQKLNGA